MGRRESSSHAPRSPSRGTLAAGGAPASNVVPLRPGIRDAGGPPDTTGVTLDLQAQIDNLRLLKADLEAYRSDHGSSTTTERSERYQAAFWIRQLADRTAALEAIFMDKGAPRLVLRGMTTADEAALQRACTVLDQWIREDTAFTTVFRTVASVLAATDRIAMRAAGGLPAPDPGSQR
jgi:hypothetical protein